MMSRYDPHIVVDLHTTDGSAHAYQITYAPPLHPATAAGVVDVLRNGLLPAVTKAIKAKDDMDFYYYIKASERSRRAGVVGRIRRPGGGRVPGRTGCRGRTSRCSGWTGRGRWRTGSGSRSGRAQQGELTGSWRPRRDARRTRRGSHGTPFTTTEPTARYGVNMVGLRNRLGILSETFSYLPFQDRIKAARRFVEEICNLCADAQRGNHQSHRRRRQASPSWASRSGCAAR